MRCCCNKHLKDVCKTLRIGFSFSLVVTLVVLDVPVCERLHYVSHHPVAATAPMLCTHLHSLCIVVVSSPHSLMCACLCVCVCGRAWGRVYVCETTYCSSLSSSVSSQHVIAIPWALLAKPVTKPQDNVPVKMA